MERIKHPSGAIEYIKTPDEKDLDSKLKVIKNKKPKKASDLTKDELEDLIILIAKHLGIL